MVPWFDFGARAVVGLGGRDLDCGCVERSSSCAKRSSGLFDAFGGILVDYTCKAQLHCRVRGARHRT